MSKMQAHFKSQLYEAKVESQVLELYVQIESQVLEL